MIERSKVLLLAAEAKGSSGAIVAERTEYLIENYNSQAGEGRVIVNTSRLTTEAGTHGLIKASVYTDRQGVDKG